MDIGGGRISIPEIDVLAEHPEAEAVRISGLRQDTFEYFIQTYGQRLRAIHFFKNKLVEDWSLLGTLPKLEQRELEKLEKDIEALTAEKAELEAKLSGGLTDVAELQSASTRFSEVSEMLDSLETRWLELSI